MNAITNTNQPVWGNSELLDAREPDELLPQRASSDTRRVSSHGKRFLSALSGCAVIFNGLLSWAFDSSVTRLPTRIQDCAGVLDYIFGPPGVLDIAVRGSLQVVSTPADLSDHRPVAIALDLGCLATVAQRNVSESFSSERLSCLRLPQDPQTWAEVNQALQNHEEYDAIRAEISIHMRTEGMTRDNAQSFIDSIVRRIVDLI